MISETQRKKVEDIKKRLDSETSKLPRIVFENDALKPIKVALYMNRNPSKIIRNSLS